MHSLHLILSLGLTVVVGVPLQPRQWDDFGGGDSFDAGDSFNFGGGGDIFGDSGIGLGDGSGDISFDMGGGGLDNSFNVADNSWAGGDLGSFGSTSAEFIDQLPSVDPSTVADNLYVDPAPDVVADVQPTDPGLGAVSGDLLAMGPTTPDTNQVTPPSGLTVSFDNNTPPPDFTPTDSGIVDSLDNLNPADIASSNSPPVTDPGTAVAVTPDPGTVAPSDGLSIVGYVAPPDLGSDTALTPNLDLINNPISFGSGDTDIAATLPDISTPPVEVAAGDGSSIGTSSGPSLDQFKQQASQLANDQSLSSDERQTWKDVSDVAANLSPSDYGKLTLNDQFTTPVKQSDGTTVPGDKISDLSPQAQGALQRAPIPVAYRTNNGFNWGNLANVASQSFLQVGARFLSLLAEKSVLQNGGTQIYTVVQRVGVPVSVAVPVTVRVGVAVPVTVATTLPGGVVTRILVYRPNTVTTVRTSTVVTTSVTGTNRVVVTGTPTPTVKPAGKYKRASEEESLDSDAAPKSGAAPESSAEGSDPEFYSEPEPQEWEHAHGGEAIIFPPADVPAYDPEGDKPEWEKIRSSFRYQHGDYSGWDDDGHYPDFSSSPPGYKDEDEDWYSKHGRGRHGRHRGEDVKPTP